MVSEPYSSQGEAMRKLGLVEWQKSRPVSRLGTNQINEKTNEMGRFSGPGYLAWYDKMLMKHDLENIAKYCDFVANVDVSSLLEEISVPTLIVAPTNSMASPVSLSNEMADRISDSRLVFIESIGHMVYIDEPEKTCSTILTWVNDVQHRSNQ
jgi:pimeloyl-ACP methyl ester carboxylesterase